MREPVRISVVTAVLNGAATVADCLRSVAAQTLPGTEHVVVDGGSTDGTVEIVRGFRERRGPFVSERDRGIFDALNKGIRLATGDVVGVLGADDAYEAPDVLAEVARTLDRTGADSCYGDLVYVRRDDPSRVVRYWRAGDFRPGLFRRGWMPPHPTFFARRRLFEALGGFRTDLRIAADYELMLRFLERHRVSTVHVPRVLVRMRLGGTSNAGLRRLVRKSREDARALSLHGYRGAWGTVALKNVVKFPQFFRRPPGG